MWITTNPKRFPELWTKLALNLTKHPEVHIVVNGVANTYATAHALSVEEARECVKRFQQCDIAMLGASHGDPIPIHFAADVNGQTATLKEYIAMQRQNGDSVSEMVIHEDMCIVSIALSFYHPDIERVSLPFQIIEEETEHFRLLPEGQRSLLILKD